jgi:predicted metal-dependent RNase
MEYGQVIEPLPGIHLQFRNAGHILGSAIAVLDIKEDQQQQKRCVFTGDIGMKGKVLMPDPELISQADILVVESTYGDRLHRSLKETEKEFIEVIKQVKPKLNYFIKIIDNTLLNSNNIKRQHWNEIEEQCFKSLDLIDKHIKTL